MEAQDERSGVRCDAGEVRRGCPPPLHREEGTLHGEGVQRTLLCTVKKENRKIKAVLFVTAPQPFIFIGGSRIAWLSAEPPRWQAGKSFSSLHVRGRHHQASRQCVGASTSRHRASWRRSERFSSPRRASSPASEHAGFCSRSGRAAERLVIASERALLVTASGHRHLRRLHRVGEASTKELNPRHFHFEVPSAGKTMRVDRWQTMPA